MTTVIILERNEVTRLGLKAALQSSDDIEIIGDYEGTDMMMTDLSSLNPDVVILGGTEDILDRCRTCQEVRTLCSAAKVLTLSEKQRDDELHELILAGASGNVSRDAGSSEMIRSVGVLSHGGLNFEAETLKRLLEQVPRQLMDVRVSALEELTERERTVLEMVAQGSNNVEIGRSLSLSKFTVRNNIAEIRTKLNVNSRAELAAIAVRFDLMDLLRK